MGVGWSHFAVGLPLLVPLIVLGGRDPIQRLDRRARPMAVGAVIVVVLSTATLQFLAVSDLHRRSHDLVESAIDLRRRPMPAMADSR